MPVCNCLSVHNSPGSMQSGQYPTLVSLAILLDYSFWPVSKTTQYGQSPTLLSLASLLHHSVWPVSYITQSGQSPTLLSLASLLHFSVWPVSYNILSGLYHLILSLKATVTNLKGRVEKLSPQESPQDVHTVLRAPPERTV